DGSHEEGLAAALLEGMRRGLRLEGAEGTVEFDAVARLRDMDDLEAPHHLGVEQSNVSVSFGNRVILKIYRRLRAGEQPDVEVARFLSGAAGFPHTPQYLGAMTWRPAEGG